MSGSAPTNSAAVDFEKQQAAEADQKEADRQARLTQGQTLIDQIFDGSPVMGTKSQNFDWSSFNPTPNRPAMVWQSQNPTATLPAGVDLMTGANAPAGYTPVQVAPKVSTAALSGLNPTSAGGGGGGITGLNSNGTPIYTPSGAGSGITGLNSNNTPIYGNAGSAGGATGAGGAASSVWALQGPDGKIYNQGDPLSYDTQYDTGEKTGGFDDAFFDAYKQKVLDYYQPDEERQYDAAQRDLRYSLARAGTLQSSTAADKQGELAYNDALQKANIVANANSQEGQLKSQIQSNKQSLINQLYATEDPTLTANLAQSSANATRLQDPTLTPAAALFTPALTTVGSAVQGLLYPSGQGGSAFANPNTSPTPASASGTRSGQLTL